MGLALATRPSYGLTAALSAAGLTSRLTLFTRSPIARPHRRGSGSSAATPERITMRITRTTLSFERNFTQIPNVWTRDKRLSWKARGLLGYLLSHAEGWRTTVADLIAAGPDGRDSIRAGLAELRANGYLVRDQAKRDDGTFAEVTYTLADPHSPLTGYPSPGEPSAGEPSPGNPPLQKNNNSEDQGQEHHDGPAGARPATEAQREYLLDLQAHGGAAPTPGFIEWVNGLTLAEADAEIKEALAVLPRGRDYLGDADAPSLSEKGREVAAARMIPRGRDA